MLTFSMPSKIDLSLKGLVAEAALERLVARVLAHMSDQIAALRERFTAYHAFVGLLTGVNVRVLLHVRFLVKPLAAILTGVGSRVGVN